MNSQNLRFSEALQCSKTGVFLSITQATAALTNLKPTQRDKNIFLRSMVKLVYSLVISIFLYVFDLWTMTEELVKRSQAFEMGCY